MTSMFWMARRACAAMGVKKNGGCESAVFVSSHEGYIESLAQLRGVMFFSFAYWAASDSTLARTSLRSGSIQSVITFHLAPSHCWNFTRPEPTRQAEIS